MAKKTRYPSFQVMDEREEWDTHTQTIVSNRLLESEPRTVLDTDELQLLQLVCSALVDDDRGDVMTYVMAHVGQSLQSSTGEGQRKSGIPEQKKLILDGIQYLDELRQQTKITNPTDETESLTELLSQVSKGTAAHVKWSSQLQREWFMKILNLTVEAYCSHPVVWSEMGYAGPAYPRGYVRGDIGRLDPWEAKEEA